MRKFINIFFIFSSKPLFYEKSMNILKNDSDSTVKIAMLLYIEAVLHWLNHPLKSFKKDALICPYSSEISTYIMDTYSIVTANGR